MTTHETPAAAVSPRHAAAGLSGVGPETAGSGPTSQTGTGPLERGEGSGPVPPPVWPRCVCGHPRGVHDIAGDKHTRTKCLTWRGPKGTPCGCKRYELPEVGR